MRKYIFGFIVIVAIAFGFAASSNPIDTCPVPVAEVAQQFAKHAESEIVDAKFAKTETSVTGNVVRHYYDISFRQGETMRTRRIVLPIDRGAICPAHFIN